MLTTYRNTNTQYLTAFDYSTMKWDSALRNAKLQRFNVTGRGVAAAYKPENGRTYFYTGKQLWSIKLPNVTNSSRFFLSPDEKDIYYFYTGKGRNYLLMRKV